MPLLQRIAIVFGLWLLAGIACGTFADVPLDCGEDETTARQRFALFTPVIAAAAIAIPVVGDHHATWQQGLVFWIVLACFVAHAIVTVTRRDRRQFMVWMAVQLLILGGCVSRVIGFFRHFAEVGW